MFGFALINVSLYEQTSTTFTKLWLTVGLVVCLGLTGRQIRSMSDFVLAIGGLIVVYGVWAAQEPWASFWLLLWLVPVSLSLGTCC